LIWSLDDHSISRLTGCAATGLFALVVGIMPAIWAKARRADDPHARDLDRDGKSGRRSTTCS